MIKNKIIFSIFFFLIFLIARTSVCLENKILFTINNDTIITSIDIYNEIKYLRVLNKELSQIDDNNILEIAKNSLINEKIKKKEIIKYTDNVLLEDKYLNSFIKSIYKNLNFSSDNDFKVYLEQNEIDIKRIKEKVSIELIWNDLILSKFSNNLKIDKDEIKNSLEINFSKTTKEFLLSELIFKISDNLNLDEKTKLINNDIKMKGFKNATLIHSISNSVQKNGGQIGWVNENSINVEIKKKLEELKIGEHTNPIIIPGGFLILKLDDIKNIEITNIDIEKKIDEIAKIKAAEQLNNYSNIYFEKIKKEYKINAK